MLRPICLKTCINCETFFNPETCTFIFCQIVALPYNTLLHQSTREASGIQLKDNIIVIDEAHNLLETINNVHSVEATGAQVMARIIMLTCLCNVYTLTPHFYIEKLGFTGIYIFLIFARNIERGYSLEPPEACTQDLSF